MDESSGGGAARDMNGRFLPGSGGRPRGARNLMSRRIAVGVLRHYEEHEAEILEELRRFHTVEFMRLIGKLAEIGPEDVVDLEPLAPEEVARRAKLAAAALVEAEKASRREFHKLFYGPGDDGE